MAKHLRLSAQL